MEEERESDSEADTPDMCYIVPEDNRSVAYYLGDGDGGYDEYIEGTVYWDQIADMEDSFDSMYKQGRKTGRCAGQVKETYPDEYPRAFDTGAYHGSGDSGGPHFTLSNGIAYYAGGHIGSSSNNSYSYAGYWEDHFEMLDLEFK